MKGKREQRLKRMAHTDIHPLKQEECTVTAIRNLKLCSQTETQKERKVRPV